MHIPDGLLEAKVWLAADVAAAVIVGICARKVRKDLAERQVPLLGVMGAFVFAAQMVNFPVLGGTSGHFAGGALVAIALGPAAGVVVMTCVLVLQCLVFQDGGLTALGANILNMAVVGCFLGYGAFNLIRRIWGGAGGLTGAGFAAGWISLVGAATVCGLELGLSHRFSILGAVGAMGGVHALIGIGEGVVTATALNVLARVRPELLQGSIVRGEAG